MGVDHNYCARPIQVGGPKSETEFVVFLISCGYSAEFSTLQRISRLNIKVWSFAPSIKNSCQILHSNSRLWTQPLPLLAADTESSNYLRE